MALSSAERQRRWRERPVGSLPAANGDTVQPVLDAITGAARRGGKRALYSEYLWMHRAAIAAQFSATGKRPWRAMAAALNAQGIRCTPVGLREAWGAIERQTKAMAR
jgi:hypothetical protein